MAAMSRRRLTPIVLHYPPHHGRPPTLSATDNPANTAAWDLAGCIPCAAIIFWTAHSNDVGQRIPLSELGQPPVPGNPLLHHR